ncbi:MAG: hypothetical protein WDZ88_04425 [Candidatus Paceibacterota bacterium]
MTDDVRKELISYYKWVVSLAIFVAAVAVSLVSAVENIHVTKIGKVGLVLLFLSIFLNWALIKRLVLTPIVAGTPEESKGFIHKLFESGKGNIKWYALAQNLSFVGGVLFVFYSLFIQL